MKIDQLDSLAVPPTTPRVTSQMSRELGVIFCAAPTCGSWEVLWEVFPTKKQKSLSGIHGNSSNGSGAEFRLQKFSSKKTNAPLHVFASERECLSWVQSYKPLDSERNAAALWAKDSSPPWQRSYTQSANVSGWVVSWRCFEQMALASSS